MTLINITWLGCVGSVWHEVETGYTIYDWCFWDWTD